MCIFYNYELNKCLDKNMALDYISKCDINNIINDSYSRKSIAHYCCIYDSVEIAIFIIKKYSTFIFSMFMS